KCDSGLTTDSARILRIPGTLNHKYDPPRPVQLEFLERDYDFAMDLALLKTVGSPQATSGQPTSDVFDNSALVGQKPILAFDPEDTLSAGLRDEILLDPKPILAKCGFLQDAFFK